ncbi:MAG: aminoglycoside phosphotransferase family protein [Pseudomonadota bacterium]
MKTERFLAACRAFAIPPADAELVAETAVGHVWRVPYAGGAAALKVVRAGAGASEAPAARMYRYWAGVGAVRLLGEGEGALLLEWLEGPPLGDRARGGDLMGSDAALVALAPRLHAACGPDPGALPSLEAWCADLFTLDPARPPEEARRWFDAARALASHLLETAPRSVPLHGDLHHDNVIVTAKGLVAFDPKGISGDPAYELANAFRNPKGIGAGLGDAKRVAAFAEAGAAALGVPVARVIGWAAVKSALSLAWSMSGRISHTPAAPEMALLATLGRTAERHFG